MADRSMLVYIICTERAEGYVPDMNDPDIVGRRFYETFDVADMARTKLEREAKYNGFDVKYQIFSVLCIVQQRVEFEAPF